MKEFSDLFTSKKLKLKNYIPYDKIKIYEDNNFKILLLTFLRASAMYGYT